VATGQQLFTILDFQLEASTVNRSFCRGSSSGGSDGNVWVLGVFAPFKHSRIIYVMLVLDSSLKERALHLAHSGSCI